MGLNRYSIDKFFKFSEKRVLICKEYVSIYVLTFNIVDPSLLPSHSCWCKSSSHLLRFLCQFFISFELNFYGPKHRHRAIQSRLNRCQNLYFKYQTNLGDMLLVQCLQVQHLSNLLASFDRHAHNSLSEGIHLDGYFNGRNSIQPAQLAFVMKCKPEYRKKVAMRHLLFDR